ncbi:MAG TPA: ROK family transcriptional regulator [Candidatus Galloscillospira excrementavium]|nr:ROK family transcriptional regulator [Candidatus Galloscillospira excrementavium]
MKNVILHSTIEVRRANRNRVFRYLYEATEPVTKQDLAYAPSMSLPTLTQNLNELLEEGLIDNSETADSSGGRKPRILTVVPGARYAVGVELSSNHIRLVALDLQVREVGFRVVQRPFRADREYADRLARTIEAFLDETGVPREKLLGVGITVPGIVDGDQASLTGAYTLGIRQLDIGALVSAIPYPVHLVNDANAGGFAECWGRTGVEHMAYLSLSRGVGGAILVSWVVYLGNSGRSGEFGHMCVHPGGAPCSCGRRGCLEAYCSTARLSDDLGLTLEQFFGRVSAGDPSCTGLWESYLDDLAIGICNIHTALDCGIVLGGKLSVFLAERFDAIGRRLSDLDSAYRESPYLSVCRYHDRSNSIGAALCFIHKFVDQI